ncbi:MAG: hypothetical protein HQL31_02985 [Planctomycetes bacterium]|nr:hypothetical protein [Planctomycetota bacterium]
MTCKPCGFSRLLWVSLLAVTGLAWSSDVHLPLTWRSASYVTSMESPASYGEGSSASYTCKARSPAEATLRRENSSTFASPDLLENTSQFAAETLNEGSGGGCLLK